MTLIASSKAASIVDPEFAAIIGSRKNEPVKKTIPLVAAVASTSCARMPNRWHRHRHGSGSSEERARLEQAAPAGMSSE